MKTASHYLLVLVIACLASPVVTSAQRKKDLTLNHCVVSLIDEAQIPTKKPGVVMRFQVAEGSVVKAGDLLAQIDDRESQIQAVVAQRQLDAAYKKAENDIDIRYARAAAEVAKAEVLSAQDANRKVPNTVPASEVRRLILARERAVLGIEQAEFQFAAARMETGIAEAQLDGAKLEISSRRVVSPLDGIVVRLHRHNGEWVDAGQPLCHIVGLDRMRVTGFVNIKDHEPSQMVGARTKVSVPLANGTKEDFEGVIGFASPIVQAGGDYRVWVDVQNRRLGNYWILRPGRAAEMTIFAN